MLEEVFDLNMVLEEIRSGDESARPQLIAAEERFRKMLTEIDEDLAAKSAASDAGNRSMLEEIRAMLNRRKYVSNLVRDVEKAVGQVSDLP